MACVRRTFSSPCRDYYAAWIIGGRAKVAEFTGRFFYEQTKIDRTAKGSAVQFFQREQYFGLSGLFGPFPSCPLRNV